MIIREIETRDIKSFFDMMCQLDQETEFMMYEPGERLEKLADLIVFEKNMNDAIGEGDLILVSENNDGEIVGFLWAERGKLNRVRHTAYIVTGIRKAFRHRGLGTAFLEKTDEWAVKEKITRLELTVECQNVDAVNLYKHAGFAIEGTRKKSMRVNDSDIDEYYMAKLF